MGRAKPASKGSPEKKVRKQRRKKDKDAPKRPCTAFFYFVQACRDKNEHKDMKVAEFTKQCGARWHKLTTDDKCDFHTKAGKDKQRYENEMKIYNPAKCKDSTKPKKPMTPFLLFVGSVRQELLKEGFKHKEVLGEAAAKWRGMDESEKESFVKDAEVLKRQYEIDMKKWQEDNAGAAATAPKPKAKPAPKKAAQKNGKESEDESDEEEDDEEEEDEEEEDDDEEMESDDE